MLAQVPMDAKLAESLQQVAAERGKPLELVMNDLVRQYLREARREVIRQEVQHYQALHADLKAKYLGQHVAIHEGRLVDHDTDPMSLTHRRPQTSPWAKRQRLKQKLLFPPMKIALTD
jgi:hypothetical protein